MDPPTSHNLTPPREMTLRQLLDKEDKQFPLVVRTCDADDIYEETDCGNERLPPKTLIRLDGMKQIPLVHVKVLLLDDEKAIEREKGVDYVNAYNKFVDQEFLIPLHLPQKVKIVHRPRRRRRYAVVDQILQDLPRYVKVETDTLSSACSGQESKPITTGTTLELTRVIENISLECRDTGSGESYIFNQGDRVNFTAIQDEKTYALSKIVSSILLPVVINFIDHISPHDVIIYDDDWANSALLITQGPLEIIGRKTLSCLLGCMQNGNETDVKTEVVLIPETTFDNERVVMKEFPTDLQKRHFCQNRFKRYDNTDFLYQHLYLIRPEKSNIVLLQNTKPVTYEDVEDYLKPAPPVLPKPILLPSRRVPDPDDPTENPKLPKNKVQPEIWKRIVEKTRLGFGKVHKELLAQVRKSANVIKSFQRQSSAPEVTGDDDTSLFKHPMEERQVKPRSVSDSSVSLNLDRTNYRGRPLPPVPDLSKPSRTPLTTEDGYLIFKPETELRVHKIKRKNQTRDDFKLYTVQDVHGCFKLCGLEDVAEKCLQYTLDGQFLAEDIQSLKCSPFLLKEFQMRKIEMIINGWRPTFEDS